MSNHFVPAIVMANVSVIKSIKVKRLSTPLLTMAAAFTLVGCSNSQDSADDVDATAAETTSASESGEVLRIGTEGAYAPFNYTNADGTLGGFDVDMANAICADMQVTCEITAQDWDGIIPGLKAGKYDAIVAAMSITPERAQQVSFTDPYFSNTLVFLAKKDSSFDPSQSSDINAHSIAAQRSTISSQWLEDAYPKANMKLYDTLSNAFLDLGSGRVDAMISDKLPALEWLSSPSGSGYVIKGDEIDIDDNFAIAVRPGDDLQAKINQSLANLKADGTYDKLNQKYFAMPAAETVTDNEVTSTVVIDEPIADTAAQ
ncbi:ABC transporter substrate-binding protein [uncultured Psychrobacter sp.]|uniref:ABC transporter substrate-binding protein n=1 Tax=uncultured Psychrobacter sp. TaxID=259303 RepID=UPI0026109F5D|nr:ABC transporter substrate-binding protein [uncultured Psychrobacter sp.]